MVHDIAPRTHPHRRAGLAVRVVIVTGSAGLVGSEAARFYAHAGHLVVGIDNDMRSQFFGAEASTRPTRDALIESLGERYLHKDTDIRDAVAVDALFSTYGSDVYAVIHTASQPSHDWAAREPSTDFGINATATLSLLEATRKHAPSAPFVFTSTNKVYGDTPNLLPFVELETRWDLPTDHPSYSGVSEAMSIDNSTHSLFGVSKAAADLLVQEYGRYFGLRTVAFRCGCITGPAHAAAKLHGFLAYLGLCFREGRPYQVIGYRGKQVRDNIASVDLVRAFDAYIASDLPGGLVLNMGGGRDNSCSVLEAIDMCARISGRTIEYDFVDTPRIGDHQWYISDLKRSRELLPDWDITESLQATITALFDPVPQRG